MRVREIRLRNVMSHADTRVALPDVGLVVVTGPNGAGKSTLVEGVALACWGKTLRGTSGWAEGAKVSEASVRTDTLRVERTRRGGKVSLAWEPDAGTEEGRAAEAALRLSAGGRGHVWESATQAQDELERQLPAFDVWRRGCAFSASDAAHFSTASDGERKRLLEAILGLGRFDPALERCRRDLRQAEAEVARLTRAAEAAAAGAAQAARRLADAEAVLAEAEVDPVLAADAAARLAPLAAEERVRLRRSVERTREDVRQHESALRRFERAGGEHEAEARAVRASIAKLEGGSCPACEQPVPPEHLASLRSRAAEAASEFASTRAEVARAKLVAEGQLHDLRAELEILLDRERALDRAEAADAARREGAARAAERRRRAEATVAAAGAELERLRSEHAAAETGLAGATRAAAVLAEVERVLGLRGVRAHLLARSLAGLDGVANAWLPKLGLPGLKLRLRPYSDRKAGGVVDSISVEVSGAGGGHGYRGASAGERRRIDLALLVGVSEVAAAALGRSGSTLWFDELFDGLDAEGVEAASSALAELARDRTVVVVTHSKELAERLPARLRLRVERGRVSESL